MQYNMKIMGISELSKQSGIPVSTIKFYIRKGMLPPAIKTGKTMAYYTDEHLNRLRLIKKIQEGESLPLDKIKEIIINAEEGKKYPVHATKFINKRAAIVKAAIDLFRKQGYETTTIADIVDAAHIGRSTFYINFKDKKELFIECLEKTLRDVQEVTWNSLDEEEGADFEEKLKESMRSFLKIYPEWSDMLNMLRTAVINNPEKFSAKLEDALAMNRDHLIKAIERGKEKGIIRKVDSKLVSVMLLGIMDYFGHYLVEGDFSGNRDKLIDMCIDVVLNGIKT